MKVTSLLFKIFVFWPHDTTIFFLPISSVLVATMVVFIFFSGNAMFFVKEILLEFCIAVDIELSIAALPLDDSTNNRNKKKAS